MKFVFTRFGKVTEVYIPDRKDKQGNRFGFVRFKNVSNIQELEAQLTGYSLLIGNQKLCANIPKYDRGGNKKGMKHSRERRMWHVGAGTRNGSSYVEVVAAGRRIEASKCQVIQNNRRWNQKKPIQQGAWNGMEILVTEEEMHWLIGSFVGKTRSLDGAFTIQKDLDFAGWSSIRATPLSRSVVLLSGDKQESVKEFLNQEAASLSFWLEEINDWNPEMKVAGRRVWVNITGLPAHAWNERVFKSLVISVGSFGVRMTPLLKNREWMWGESWLWSTILS